MRVVGLGFRKGASLASLRDALDRAGGAGADALASAADKAAAPVMQALAAALGLPVIGVAAGRLAAQPVATSSPRVQALRGTGSVCEAAALAGAGPGARLVCARVVSGDGMATAALAEAAA